MTNQLSNCCKAPATVSSSDEGTSCYMCSECKRSCDVFVDEQVSVSVDEAKLGMDKTVYQVYMPIEEWQRLKQLEKDCMRLDKIKEENKELRIALNELGEFNRLNRLDENIKKRIKLFINKRKEIIVNSALCLKDPAAIHLRNMIDLLESLYDE